MAGRMQRPERGNDFGRVGDSLDAALAGYRPFVAAWRRFGARSVDATRDMATVADDLLLTAATALRLPGNCGPALRPAWRAAQLAQLGGLHPTGPTHQR